MSGESNTPKELESLLSTLQDYKSQSIDISQIIQQLKNEMVMRLKAKNIQQVRINNDSKNEIITTITVKKRITKNEENQIVLTEAVSDTD